jgi:ribonucleoside-diphosphate reductase subunit M2
MNSIEKNKKNILQNGSINDNRLDPILTPNPNRFVLFPIKYDDIWKLYKKHEDSFWRAEEINLAQDLNDWEKLNDDERDFIKRILAFFSSSDGIVQENLISRFSCEVQIPEARAFYAFQGMMEMIHSETYSLLIDTYVKDVKEKNALFNAVDNYPCIAKKANWAKKWITDKKSSFASRLFSFACIEGIFFSGAFCAIYWLKNRGLMHGLTFSNELIVKDEGMHVEFAVLLYSKLVKKLPKKKMIEILKECVEIEKEFIIESLPCRLIGMNEYLMADYIQYVADRLLVQFGCEKIYNKKNPFDFMEMISVQNKTNFFEATVSDYSLSKKNNGNNDLVFDESVDF